MEEIIKQDIEQTSAGEPVKVDEPAPKQQEPSYVKDRVERGKAQREKELLTQLGVSTIEDALTKINSGQEAMNKITQLEERLSSQAQATEKQSKLSQIEKRLSDERVFDAEMLASQVDLDSVQLDAAGRIIDMDGIVNSLKAVKPNFFAKFERVGDTYIKGSNTTPQTARELQQSGDTRGALNSYLKSIL